MALPAGRYGVTKNQLLKIKKLPMNTIKLIEDLTEKFNLLGSAAFKNSTSVVTESSDLVESGAVFDTIGWGNKNANTDESSYTFTRTSTRLKNFSTSLDSLSVGDEVTLICNCTAISNLDALRIDIESNNTALTGTYSISATGKIVIKMPVITASTAGQPIVITMWINTTQGSSATCTLTDIKFFKNYKEKCDSNVIAPTENGTTASQAYAVGSHAIRNGAFITWKNAKAQGETINDASDYTSGQVGDIVYLSGSKSIAVTANTVAWTDFDDLVPFSNYDILGFSFRGNGGYIAMAGFTWVNAADHPFRVVARNFDTEESRSWTIEVYIIIRVK